MSETASGDIVARLQDNELLAEGHYHPAFMPTHLCVEAADEIERLRGECETWQLDAGSWELQSVGRQADIERLSAALEHCKRGLKTISLFSTFCPSEATVEKLTDIANRTIENIDVAVASHLEEIRSDS